MVTDWDPGSLRAAMATGDDSLIHNLDMTKKTFEMLLKAGIKQFPESLGLIFQKCGRKTACEVAFDKLGVEEVMPIICQYIPPDGNHIYKRFIWSNTATGEVSCCIKEWIKDIQEGCIILCKCNR